MVYRSLPPFWTIRGRASDLGCKAELEWTRGCATASSWPVGNTTNLRLEMGQDGADQYATAMVSARGPLADDNSLILGMTGPVIDLAGQVSPVVPMR